MNNNNNNNEMQSKIADNALYMLIFYVIKLLVNNFADRHILILENGKQVLVKLQILVKYLIKFYNVIFNMNLFIEMMLLSLAAYQHHTVIN